MYDTVGFRRRPDRYCRECHGHRRGIERDATQWDRRASSGPASRADRRQGQDISRGDPRRQSYLGDGSDGLGGGRQGCVHRVRERASGGIVEPELESDAESRHRQSGPHPRPGIGVYARGETTDIRLAWGRFVLPGLRQDLAALMDW